jgi:hypothetical protein
MKLFDIFSAILYGASFILIIYFIFDLFYKKSPSTVVLIKDETPVYQESSIYPWYGGYNWYNTWSPWRYTGSGYRGGLGYRRERRWGPHSTVNKPWGGSSRSANRGGFDRKVDRRETQQNSQDNQ